ncbi:MAG: hypothetical protein PF569_05275 [Candidatus Woesearchaeota archaeon]|jgi:hypothetical protein|nr:hypothetical protein [Candidatus Woesearchaeota archaeon]
MVKTIKAIFISSLVIIILMLGLTFADGNGIWNYAKDLRPGVFGSDEGNSSAYEFTNPLIADTFDVNDIGADIINVNDINADTINASRIDSIEIYKNGDDVATLDASGKVPLGQLPFHKGDLISPTDRPLISGLSGYDTNYFSIGNLGISGSQASNVREGITFGPSSSLSGSLSDDVICTTAGGNANCGVTSIMTPGTFYAMVGTNSPSDTNYCTKFDLSSDGSISSTNVATASICDYISSCDSSSQTSSLYSDGTSCGTGQTCQSGTCDFVMNAGTYSYYTYAYGGCSGAGMNVQIQRIINGVGEYEYKIRYKLAADYHWQSSFSDTGWIDYTFSDNYDYGRDEPWFRLNYQSNLPPLFERGDCKGGTSTSRGYATWTISDSSFN